MSQLNGTALPSLALENLQELEDLKLSESDHDRAEETIAGALASLYTGRCLRPCLDPVQANLYNSWVRYRKSMRQYPVHEREPEHHLPDCFGPDVFFCGNVALP